MQSNNPIKADIIFGLYFFVMICLYTYTYVQLAAQMLIILYVLSPFVKTKLKTTKLLIKKSSFDEAKSFVAWYGAFALLLFVSKRWAYSSLNGSKTMLTVFRIFVICFFLIIHCSTKDRILGVFKSFASACFCASVIVLLTTPISQWGLAGQEEGFGAVIGQHRNGLGAISAALALLVYSFDRRFSFRLGKLMAGYFVGFTLITGSRGSILQIVIILTIHMLFNQKNLTRKAKNFFWLVAISLILIPVFQAVPFLYSIVWSRVEGALYTILGKSAIDTSTLGRQYYKMLALQMFLQRPILGYGLDGFVCYLRDHPVIMGTYIRAVYAHCNYAEIGADLGIVGLIVWYLPILKNIFHIMKKRTISRWNSCVVATFFSIVILDYSRIPWETHMSMYLIVIVLLLLHRCLDEESKPSGELSS